MKLRILTCLMIFFLILRFSSNLNAQVSRSDSLALVNFYQATNGPGWYNRTNWLSGEPVPTWHGVHTSGEEGETKTITGIELRNNNLSGAIPSGIAQIKSLNFIILLGNRLAGGLPVALGGLLRLSRLILSDNRLSGPIPFEIGQLSALKELRLEINNLSGAIPAAIGSLTHLENLTFNENNLTGEIPGEICNLTNLQVMDLSDNQLSGSIPEKIGNLVRLEKFRILRNEIGGSIPVSISNLIQLKEFNILQNEITGDLPQGLFTLPNLQYLILNENQITGSIPETIQNLRNLEYFSATNNHLSGAIPKSIGYLTKLKNISLHSNQLSGEIPKTFGGLSNLEELNLNNNNLSGEIPPELGTLKNIQGLYLANNNLSGNVPILFSTLTKLESLELQANDLQKLPKLSSISSLSFLNISGNKFNFDDIEPNIRIPEFNYIPQDTVGEPSEMYVFTGQECSLKVDMTAEHNKYQWFHDDEEMEEGAINPYLIPEVAFGDSGKYCCQITNSVVPDLTLYTHPIQVEVNEVNLNAQVILNSDYLKYPKLLYDSNNEEAVPVKVCADGSETCTLIKINIESEDITVDDIGLRIRESDSGVDAHIYGLISFSKSENEKQIEFHYRHPRVLPVEELYHEIHLEVYFAANQGVIHEIPVHIYRAPIVFVHGIWSNSECFAKMKSKLVSEKLWPDMLIHLVDYEPTNSNFFQTNYGVVGYYCKYHLQYINAYDFSASKVNVVGHSMGGLLTRLSIQNRKFPKIISRFITVNTPHSGTQIANDIQINPVLRKMIDISGRDTWGGAVSDLRVDSDEINYMLNGQSSLNYTIGIPIHSIVTTTKLIDQTISSNFMLTALIFIGYDDYKFMTMYNNENYDLIVPESSQRGGLQYNTSSTILSKIWHLSTAEPQVMTRIKELLNEDPENTNVFSHAGFHPPKLVYYPPKPPKPEFPDKIAAKSTGTVKITSPAPGATLFNGNEVSIQVQGSEDIQRILIFAGYSIGEAYSEIRESSSASFQYTVQNKYVGPSGIVAFGMDSEGNIVVDSLNVFIETNAGLTGIHTSQYGYFLNEGSSIHISLYGSYDDGVTRNLTEHPDAIFETQNEGIARFTEPGVLEGVTADTTVATFRLGEYVHNIGIIVLPAEPEPILPDTANFVMDGESTSDLFGVSVVSAGDVNADGYDDVLIGAQLNDAGGFDAGRAYLYFGGPVFDNEPDRIFTGENSRDWFGGRVAKGGDINGDGYSDVVISAYGKDSTGVDAGLVYIYFGGKNMDTVPDALLSGEAAQDSFGFRIDASGDFNNDGICDLLIGAIRNDTNGRNSGRAYLYFGGKEIKNIPDVIFEGKRMNDVFGRSLANIGDVNGDGIDDLAIGGLLSDGNPSYPGRIEIFFGGESMDNQPDACFLGETNSDGFGNSVAAAGDVNDDGYGDIIIGALANDNQANNAGSAYIYSGGDSLNQAAPALVIRGATADAFLGISVDGVGDLTGDGISDFVVGEYRSGPGYVYLYSGGPEMDDIPDKVFAGENEMDFFGFAASNAGDVNGDGVNDIIIGADRYDGEGVNVGRVYLFLNSLSVESEHTVQCQSMLQAEQFELFQNYPNPFNPITTIRFNIPTASHVTLKIFNILGEQIMTLIDNELDTGMHQVNFHSENLASGIYFYQLDTGNFNVKRKMLVLK